MAWVACDNYFNKPYGTKRQMTEVALAECIQQLNGITCSTTEQKHQKTECLQFVNDMVSTLDKEVRSKNVFSLYIHVQY